MDKTTGILDAIDALIRATLDGKVRWSAYRESVGLGIGNGQFFVADYAGMKLELYEKTAQKIEWMLMKGLRTHPLEKLNLDITENGGQTWHIPYQPRLDELLDVVKRYTSKLPPQSVIDRLIKGSQN